MGGWDACGGPSVAFARLTIDWLSGSDRLIDAAVQREAVSQPGDPERLRVPVASAGQHQRSAYRLQPLPVADDHGQRARVHELDGGPGEHEPAPLPAGPPAVVVRPAGGA